MNFLNQNLKEYSKQITGRHTIKQLNLGIRAELVACNPPLTISTPTIEGEMCLREEEEEKSVVDTGLEVVDGILSGLFDVGKK